jgi:hypothetical protein
VCLFILSSVCSEIHIVVRFDRAIHHRRKPQSDVSQRHAPIVEQGPFKSYRVGDNADSQFKKKKQ